MELLGRIAESRIRDAMARGEFDELPGRGEPLPADALSRVPDDLRLAYRVLRNAGLVPREVELRREVFRLDHLITRTSDEAERAALRRKRLEAELHFNLLMERRARRRAA